MAAIIVDTTGQILLGKHTYRKKHPWGLLAGVLEYGEDPEKAIVREVNEETGYKIDVERLLKAVSANEDHHISLVYLCKIVDGAFQPSPEISKVQYYPSDNLPDMLETERALVTHLVRQMTNLDLNHGKE